MEFVTETDPMYKVTSVSTVLTQNILNQITPYFEKRNKREVYIECIKTFIILVDKDKIKKEMYVEAKEILSNAKDTEDSKLINIILPEEIYWQFKEKCCMAKTQHNIAFLIGILYMLFNE